jgi:hypothetical protein
MAGDVRASASTAQRQTITVWRVEKARSGRPRKARLSRRRSARWSSATTRRDRVWPTAGPEARWQGTRARRAVPRHPTARSHHVPTEGVAGNGPFLATAVALEPTASWTSLLPISIRGDYLLLTPDRPPGFHGQRRARSLLPIPVIELVRIRLIPGIVGHLGDGRHLRCQWPATWLFTPGWRTRYMKFPPP